MNKVEEGFDLLYSYVSEYRWDVGLSPHGSSVGYCQLYWLIVPRTNEFDAPVHKYIFTSRTELSKYMKSEHIASIPEQARQSRLDQSPQSMGCSSSGDGDVSGSTAFVALDRENLVVMRAEVQARLRPSIKVVLNGNGAADAVVAADGPVLVECGGALDAGLIDALRLVDVIRVAVGGDRGDLGGCFVYVCQLPSKLLMRLASCWLSLYRLTS